MIMLEKWYAHQFVHFEIIIAFAYFFLSLLFIRVQKCQFSAPVLFKEIDRYLKTVNE